MAQTDTTGRPLHPWEIPPVVDEAPFDTGVLIEDEVNEDPIEDPDVEDALDVEEE